MAIAPVVFQLDENVYRPIFFCFKHKNKQGTTPFFTTLRYYNKQYIHMEH